MAVCINGIYVFRSQADWFWVRHKLPWSCRLGRWCGRWQHLAVWVRDPMASFYAEIVSFSVSENYWILKVFILSILNFTILSFLSISSYFYTSHFRLTLFQLSSWCLLHLSSLWSTFTLCPVAFLSNTAFTIFLSSLNNKNNTNSKTSREKFWGFQSITGGLCSFPPLPTHYVSTGFS